MAFEAKAGGPNLNDVLTALNIEHGSIQRLSLVDIPANQLDLNLEIDGRQVRIRFNEHSVRSPGYGLFEQAQDGTLFEVPAGPVTTYRGTDATWPGMKAALSIEDDGFRVLIRDGDVDQWWVEPLVGRVRNATEEDYVVYLAQDIISPEGFCGVDDKGPLPDGNGPQLLPLPAGADREILSAQMVVDCDHEYYQDYGSVSAVENRVNSVINAVNLQYESQTEVTHTITGIVVRSNSNDPYSSNSIETRLNQVRSEWNSTNNPPHDVVQLFSGANFSGSTIGLAWVGSVCSTFEYSVVESDCCGSFGCTTDLSAHELGHNWNSGHCSCPGNTMNPSLTCSNNFSSSSISAITNFRNSIASCLDSASGACCTQSDACLIVTETQCLNAGGEFLGAGTDCSGSPCVDPIIGACCLNSGSCIDGTEESSCSNLGGTWQGDDTNCSGVTCPQPDPTGACCLAGGSCTSDTTDADCTTSGGDYQGDDSSCDFVDCNQVDIVTFHHAITGNGRLSIDQPNWTVDVYAAVPEGFRVDAVAGNSVQQKMITSTYGFYQDALGGPTSMAINPNLYETFPDLEWDSRVTIGALDNSGGNSLQDVGIDWTNFENGGDLSVGDGTWFILPDEAQGASVSFTSQDCSQQNGVLIARLTAMDLGSTITVEALVQGRDSGGNTWQDTVAFDFTYTPTEDCNGNMISDTCDIANGTSPDANDNGIPDECDNLCPGDADGDGDADVDDLLVVIGAFGTSGPDGDMDNNGIVNVDDILIILNYFNGC